MNTTIPPLEQAMLCSIAALFNEPESALQLLESAFLSKNQHLVVYDSINDCYRVCRSTAEFLRDSRSKRTQSIPFWALGDFLYRNRVSPSEPSIETVRQKTPDFFQAQCCFDGTSENWLYTSGA